MSLQVPARPRLAVRQVSPFLRVLPHTFPGRGRALEPRLDCPRAPGRTPPLLPKGRQLPSARLEAPPPSPPPQLSRTRSAERGKLASCDAGAWRCQRAPGLGNPGNEVMELPLGRAPSPPFPGGSVLSATRVLRIAPQPVPPRDTGQRRLGTTAGSGPPLSRFIFPRLSPRHPRQPLGVPLRTPHRVN